MKLIANAKIIEISTEDEAIVKDILKDRPWHKNWKDIFIPPQRSAVTQDIITNVIEGGNIYITTLDPLNQITKLVAGYEVNPADIDNLTINNSYNKERLFSIARQLAAAPVVNRLGILFPYTETNVDNDGKKTVHCRIPKYKKSSTADLLTVFASCEITEGRLNGASFELKLYPFQHGEPTAPIPIPLPKEQSALKDENEEGVIDLKIRYRM